MGFTGAPKLMRSLIRTFICRHVIHDKNLSTLTFRFAEPRPFIVEDDRDMFIDDVVSKKGPFWKQEPQVRHNSSTWLQLRVQLYMTFESDCLTVLVRRINVGVCQYTDRNGDSGVQRQAYANFICTMVTYVIIYAQ